MHLILCLHVAKADINCISGSAPTSNLIQGTSTLDYKALPKQVNSQGIKTRQPLYASDLRKILAPANKTNLPFDVSLALKSLTQNGVYRSEGPQIAPHWQLTTLHRPPYSLSFDPTFETSVRFSFTQDLPGLGFTKMRYITGYSQWREIYLQNQMNYALTLEQIPYGERPDMGLFLNQPAEGTVKISPQTTIGQKIFVIHSPALSTYGNEVNDIRNCPLVSIGKVLAKSGHALIVDAYVEGGSSGGAVFNSNGELVGIVSGGNYTQGIFSAVVMGATENLVKVTESLQPD